MLLCGSLLYITNAQKLKNSQVPLPAKATFSSQYPNTAGAWEKENGNYEVVFKRDGKEMSAVINAKGKLILTETELSGNDLPKNIKDYLNLHFKNAAVKGAAQIINANGAVSYEATVKGKELLFDVNGNLLPNKEKDQ